MNLRHGSILRLGSGGAIAASLKQRLHLARMGIGKAVGHGDIVTTARTYTHVRGDAAQLDYAECCDEWVRRARLFGARRKLKARDTVILQDRDVDIRDVRVRQKDETIVACGKPRPGFDGPDLQSVEPLPSERHNFKAHIRVPVVTAELLDPLSECCAEERNVEHGRDRNKAVRCRSHGEQKQPILQGCLTHMDLRAAAG